jgi:hypothetical protein
MFKHIATVLLPISVLSAFREAAKAPWHLWDYIVNGGFITICVILWVALRR